MSTATSIGRAGEGYVVAWLKGRGYSKIRWDTQAPGSTDIEAQNSAHLLIQVKTAMYPDNPEQLSAEEETAISSCAARLAAQAWEARVQVSANLELISEIKWRQV